MAYLSNFKNDPDGYYFDSSDLRGKQKKKNNDKHEEITINNSSSYHPSVEITDFDGPYYTTFGKPPVRKMLDKVYPQNGETGETGETSISKHLQKNTSPQNSLLARESNYKKIKFKKYYTTLEWYLKGATYEVGKDVVMLNVSEIIGHFKGTSAVVRDVVPIWGQNSIIGHKAKIICIEYPKLNRINCCSNIEGGLNNHFASICPGTSQEFKITERLDVLQIGKKGTKHVFLDYMDQNERYPFRKLIKDYNNQLKDKAFLRDLKKMYPSYPKNGMEYIKKLIGFSKKIPLEEIEKMEKPEWIDDYFKILPKDRSIMELTIMDPEKSRYSQFVSGCPFYEGARELRYFHGKRDFQKISLPRHKQVLNFLKLLKKERGVIPQIPFKLVLVGKEYGSRSHYKDLPGCVTLKVCVKISIA